MEPEKLESLLRRVVLRGPTAPLTPECLDIRTILALLDRPADVRQEDVRHLTTCRYCQRAVALARRDREIFDAPWPEESEDAVAAPPAGAGDRGLEEPAATRPPSTTKLSRWLGGWSARAGIAAVLVAAVGLAWWLTRDRPPQTVAIVPELLGRVTGRFVPTSPTRGDERPERLYEVTIELKTAASLTYLYLDHTRKLQLPQGATELADRFPAGRHRFQPLRVTDDPPGPQWIAAVASDEPFDAAALRNDLQQTIGGLPGGAPFNDLTEHLEQALRERPDLSFSSHRFEVPAPGGP